MLFGIGQLVATRGVVELAKENKDFKQFISKSFTRHCNGDWGDLCKEDKQMNENALKYGEDRIFRKYNFDGETSIYIITEWDRSYTTILFPEEY